jgi:hypothetical protein
MTSVQRKPGVKEYLVVAIFALGLVCVVFLFTKKFLEESIIGKPPGFGFIDKSGKLIIPEKFSRVGHFSEHLAVAYEPSNNAVNGGVGSVVSSAKCGYIDRTGSFVVTPQFVDALPFSEGLAAVQVSDENRRGKSANYFGPGIGTYLPGTKWGFISHLGKFSIEPQYDAVGSFKEGLAPFMVNNKWGFIDPKANLVVEPQYDVALPFSEDLAVVGTGRKCGETKRGYIDRSGHIAIEMKFDDAFQFSGGFALIRKGHKFGVVNKLGDFVIQPQFNAFANLSEGVAKLSGISRPPYDATKSKFVVESAGNILVFEEAPYENSNPSFKGYIDGTGSIAVRPAADHLVDLGSFHEGLASFTGGQFFVRTGYIDKAGKVVIPAQYESASDFHEGLAAVGHEPAPPF